MNSSIQPPRPINPNSLSESIEKFDELVKILRIRSSWDAKQSSESIASLSIEEVYEMIESIHQKDDDNLKKELGDLLLHIVMHSMFAEERGSFNFTDVINGIHEKLISRLPSVFTNKPETDDNKLMENWEQLKQKEGRDSLLSDIPKTVPALLRAERIQIKASRVGFDWNEKKDVLAKVKEEFEEFEEAKFESEQRKEEEFGDLLFSIVNLARFENIVPEEALMKATNKFIKRFRYIEERSKELNKDLNNMTLSEMNQMWSEAKNI